MRHTFVTFLLFVEVPFVGLFATRFPFCDLSIFLLPSAFERAERSAGVKVGSSLSVSDRRGPKRRETWIMSSLRVLIGDLSPGLILPEANIVELEGRVIARLFSGDGSVSTSVVTPACWFLDPDRDSRRSDLLVL